MDSSINIKQEKNNFEDKDIGSIYEKLSIRIPTIYFQNTYRKEGKKYKRIYVGIYSSDSSYNSQ